ncbi:molybdate ABC transporter substrate-binding protein [Mycobacterium asiaticum]|uniref:Molybdate ABC transporter substrate-binding protein n=1 Tax=Mycobacterium asiaticum TaxID=1790 RepID=A0A1A3D0P3_MYCAS|nr:molybdate ABC transporter substrate-binding protein [Mycobacterium asiaticum]OBI92568.1 molybdate ABC transporter substrate-binding protein [Mycobacterium asiaticum]OBJ89453.1 molybdate ABC transporter substrate-binding protein [Mycobacterium asiaticum]
MRRIGWVAILLVAGLTSCNSTAQQNSIVVFAAASLKQVFTQLGDRFRADNPGTGIQFNFAGSSELATQLTQGATADVFASADTAQMDRVAAAGLLADGPTTFASNTLAIVTAPGNPKHLQSFADLARSGLSVVICQQPVPCGSATRRIEESTGTQLHPVSEEPSVTDALDKVTTGQADAALVYVTDAANAGAKVATVKFPEAAIAVNTYPIAVLKKAPQSALARKFVSTVTGETGRQLLDQAGFARP